MVVDLLSTVEPFPAVAFFDLLAEGEAPPPYGLELMSALRRVRIECHEGRIPDLGPLWHMALTPDSTQEDPRWDFYHFARWMDARAFGPETSAGPLVTAIQVVWPGNGYDFLVRRNHEVRGLLWGCTISPYTHTANWELWPDERGQLSHITILNGRSHGKDGALVYWNTTLHVAGALPAKDLLRRVKRQIRVRGARERWLGVVKRKDPDEVRSFYWEADLMGVDPKGFGYYILGGLDDRRRHPTPESALERPLETLPHPTPAPQEVIEEVEGYQDAIERIARLEDVVNGDEKRLLEALRRACREDPPISRAEVARRHGWDPRDVEAVLKRLRRKAENLTQGPPSSVKRAEPPSPKRPKA